MTGSLAPHQIGMVPWYTYGSTDTAKGRDFYQQLFGWTVEQSPEPEMAEHPMFAADGVPFADIAPMPTSVPSHWATYVVVEDVDATLNRVLELGGKILQPAIDLPMIGRMACLQDPWGAAIWAYTPSEATTLNWAMGDAEGRICWHELMAVDARKAAAFYGEIFGWNVQHQPQMNLLMIHVGERPIGHIMDIPTSAQGMPSAWFLYVLASDLESTSQKATTLGAKLLMPKTEVPNTGWFCLLQDPAGAHFYLWQPARTEGEPTSA